MNVQNIYLWEFLGSGPTYYHPGFDLIGKKVEELTADEHKEVEFR